MSKKKTNIQSPAAPAEGKSRRLFWMVLAAVLVIALVWVGWYLVRFQFYDGYRQYIVEPEAAAEGMEFMALADETPAVESMSLVAENDVLKLYANGETGEVAVHDKRTGETVYSNPPAADKDPIANKKNKGQLKAQLKVDYYNANQQEGSYNSFTDCVEYGKLECQSIPDGVRFIYDIGEKKTVYFVPYMLSDERFQELYNAVPSNVQTLITGRPNSFYAQAEDGSWQVTETGKAIPLTSLKKIHDAFVGLGMTEDEYYEWQALAGVEIAETPGFSIALDWTLAGDAVECSIPPELIEERAGMQLYAIHLLPFMGAASLEESGYILVPNGSGALINFNNGKITSDQYSQYVYERDLVDAGYDVMQNLQPVRLALFAICRENSSMLATIEQGASLARITADISGVPGVSGVNKTNGYNNVYAQFVLRGFEKLPMLGTGETMTVIENDFYFEPIKVRYTLLTDENKGYSGVANYYRQRLIDEGVLTVKEEGGDIPFYYDVIGAVKETAHTMGVQHLSVKAMTTFDQAGQMAQQLGEKGVSNQVMNFQGWMNGGYYHDVTDRVSVLRQLGGGGELQELADVMETYGEMYVDVAFQRVSAISKRYNSTEESSRYYGAGYSVSFGEVNPTNLRRTSGLGYMENLYYLISPKFLPRYVDGFVGAIGSYDESIGISLRDMGNELHADKKRTGLINREEALMVLQGQMDKLRGTGRSLMISGGNDYALAGVSHILCAPLSSTEYFIVDETVPLYEMIVHGCVDYTGKPINTYVTENVEQKLLSTEEAGVESDVIRYADKELLNLIEIGASTRYIFTSEEATEMKYTGLNKYYATTFDKWVDEAVKKYNYVNEALSDVSNASMVEHASLSENLKRVTYSNGVVIYVNYGREAAQADGHIIEPMNYLKVGGESK